MCQSKAEGSRRCPTHASGSQALSYEAEREYGIPERIFRKALSIFRKEAYHNGISDKINANATQVKAFINERLKAVRESVNMSDAEKRTAIRRWTRAAKEKISMATLYSWKKASALMAAGSMAVLLSACSGTGEDTKNLPEGDSTPVASSTADPTSDHTQPSMDEKGDAFGYDFSNIEIPEDIQERYGKEASANILNDAFVPMEVIRSSQNIYSPGEKTEKTYLPLRPYMTQHAWKQEMTMLEEDNSAVTGAYASGCADDGGLNYVKKGKDPASEDENDFGRMICDPVQDLNNNLKLDNLSVSTFHAEKGKTHLSDVPEHIVVQGTVHTDFTGTSEEDGKVTQSYSNDINVYLIPDAEKENHWVIDGADWRITRGESAY